ncbi:MAG: SDR family NAD(P)-dependent oxidoreductase [Ktedonobacterales bacterium]
MTAPHTTRNSQLFDLTGKVATVTGGALGIGQAIAFRLAEAGAAVMIADFNLEAAEDTANQIRLKGEKATSISADTSSVNDAKRMVEETVRTFGRLDILVKTAGVYPFAPALEMTEAVWDKNLDINFKGLFFYDQAAALEIVHEGHPGKIINVGAPPGNLQHYDASKAAIVMVTQALALELGRLNISVNAIAPGGILTPDAGNLSPTDQRYQTFGPRSSQRRPGMPDDVAQVALFLASSASDYMTGSVLAVDGGFR